MKESLPELHMQSYSWTVGHWTFKVGQSDDRIDLNASYQRGSVWTLTQKQSLIKSLLMGLPVGAIVYAYYDFNEDPNFNYRIIDGKQRIEAVRDFMLGEFTVPGWWFPEHDLEMPEYRDRDVIWQMLSRRGVRGLEGKHLPGLEFKSGRYAVETPEAERDNPNDRWRWIQRTPAEIEAAEMEVFDLINFAGTPQENTAGKNKG